MSDKNQRMGNLILSSMNFHEDSSITFAVAERQKEIQAALTLLKDIYSEEDIIRTESLLYVTKYHILPTTKILIGLHENKVIGTVTLIINSILGIPSEKVIGKQPGDVAEVSCLALTKDFRNQEGLILLPLFRYLFSCCRHLQIKKLIIAVHPRHFSFYKYLLGFEKLGKRRDCYDFANKKPAQCGELDLTSFPEKIKYFKNQKNDLYAYFSHTTPTVFSLSQDLLASYFLLQSDAWRGLSEADILLIKEKYEKD